MSFRICIPAFLIALVATMCLAGCNQKRANATSSETIPNVWISGELHHDFGEVELPADRAPVELVHTFILTNNTEEAVRIEKLAGTCGCLEAEASREVIPPGVSFELTAIMAMKSSGPKTERVRIITSDPNAVVESVTLRAIGLLDATMLGFPRHVSLQPGRRATVTLAAIYGPPLEFETPPEPTFVNPDGVRAEFAGWERITPDNVIDDGNPIRWHGDVTFEAERAIGPYEYSEAHLEGLGDFVVVIFLDPAHENDL